MEDEQAGVHERAGYGIAVHRDVALGQMPAARAHEQGGRVLVEAILAAVGPDVLDRAPDGVDQVDLAADHVRPRGRVRVLEVGHEAARARVQRVDDHLALGRPGDLDPAVAQRRRGGRDRPLALARAALGEVERAAGVELGLDPRALREQLAAALVELLVEHGDELERVGRQDLVEAGVHRPADAQLPSIDRHSSSAGCRTGSPAWAAI